MGRVRWATTAALAIALGLGVLRSRRRIRIRGSGPPKRVIVVGGGFAGLSALMELSKVAEPRPFEVVLVDRNDYHVFTPLLYQVAAAVVRPSSVAYPLRSIAADCGFRFEKAQVLSVDLEKQALVTDRGRIPYDVLILAPGSRVHDYGIPGVREFALPLKTLPDAVRLRNRVLEWLEEADSAVPSAQPHRNLVIVGGGATGVELAGALVALIADVTGREFPRLSPGDVNVVLVEASSTLLYNMPRVMGQRALESLSARGVKVMLNSRVEEVAPQGIKIAGGAHLEASVIVWAGGIKGGTVSFEGEVPTTKDGRTLVDEFLRVRGRDDVYVVGDLAWSDLPRHGFGASAQAAVQQGRWAGRNVIRSFLGRDPVPYRYRHRGDLVIAGRYGAVANVFGVTFDGLPAWALWRLLHLTWLTGIRNRLEVLLDWAFVYIGPRPLIRLEEG